MNNDIHYQEVDDRVVICRALDKLVTGQLVEIYFSVPYDCWVAEAMKPEDIPTKIISWKLLEKCKL